MSHLVRCLLLVIIPVGVLASPPNAPRVGLTSPAKVASSDLLACEFTPDGLKVEGFQSADSTATDPQPGERCLPLLGKVAAINQPSRVGRFPLEVAQLRPDPSASKLPSLVLTVIQDGHLVEIVGCSMDLAIGLIVTSSASVDHDPPVTAPVGQHCLRYLAGRTQDHGASPSSPVAAALNPGFAGDAFPDTSALGRPCLEALAEEQKLPGQSQGAHLQLVGPWAVPAIEECLIFDFGAGGISG